MLQTAGQTQRLTFQRRGYATIHLNSFGPAWKQTTLMILFFDKIGGTPLIVQSYYCFCGPILAANTIHCITFLAVDGMSMTSLGSEVDPLSLHGTTCVYGAGQTISWCLEESGRPGSCPQVVIKKYSNALRSRLTTTIWLYRISLINLYPWHGEFWGIILYDPQDTHRWMKHLSQVNIFKQQAHWLRRTKIHAVGTFWCVTLQLHTLSKAYH